MYKVIPLIDGFALYEMATGKIVEECDTHDDAVYFKNVLETSGFEGWTPDFIDTEFHVVYS